MSDRADPLFLVVGLVLALARPAAAEPAPVRHLDHRSNGWSVAETANFRIFHDEEPGFAERAARVAERTRTAVLRKWFGAAGADWDPPCELYLHRSAGSFWRLSGVPPEVPACTRVEADGERVLARQIHVHGQEENLLAAILPHEVTHAVLAGRFGDRGVPRWVDEGMAVLTEPRDRVEGHLRNLARCYRDGRLFTPRDLLALRDYPAPRDGVLFYAESVSLVEFLAGEKGPRTFTRFVRDGVRDGYAAALAKYYGWDFDDLEQHWRAHAFGEGAGVSGAAGR
jgi:hypothetical protein